LVSSPGSGISTDPNFFPIGVWLQTATTNAQNYANVGVNTYIGQYNGNSTAALAAMKAAGIDAIAPQDSVGLADVASNGSNSVIKAWHNTNDEPDNAQPNSSGGYGPCIAPSTIVAEYNQMKAADPTRPVYLNFGQGVANVNYVGRGSCTGQTNMYPQYAQGADIVSFDVYPVNDGYPLDVVATGVDNLRSWAGNKPLYAFVETTNFDNTGPAPTPAQIKAETWLELIHGANGIEYFCHIFEPTFIEAGCLSIPASAAAMKADDAQITSLAPVLNDQTVVNGVSVNAPFRVDSMVKSHAGSTYVFSEAVNGSGNATFSIPGAGNGTVTVVGENRTLPMTGGSFQDTFASLGVHIYQVSGTIATPTPTPTPAPTSTPTAHPSSTPTPTATPTATAAPTPQPTSTPTPTAASTPTPAPISDVPCTVTINGVQRTGTCAGTFKRAAP
jgi:hypothetical protein